MNKANYFIKLLDTVVFPLKLIIPQPVIKKIPGFSSNEDLRIRKTSEYMKGYCLDIGCGNNRLIREYRDGGEKGIGIDVYPWKGVDKVVKDASKLSFEDNTFDTISFIACLNHISNRIDVLQEVQRIIKPEGRLLITNMSPVISCIWHKWAFWDRDQHERGMEEGEVYGFTKEELNELLIRTNFKIEIIERFAWRVNQLYVCLPLTCPRTL